ncbi:hypothetical protein L0337_32125 [candidate division KSB1 bacterium]|nr:hypothetical protein [candidate division KSB1 bacterium]
MALQTVTLTMPESIYRRVKRSAEVLRRPPEEIIVEALNVALPRVDDVPAEMTEELATMRALPDGKLWEIARSVMSARLQTRLRALSAAQRERALAPAELHKLDALLQEYGRITLRKAQAYALLHERGLYTHTDA